MMPDERKPCPRCGRLTSHALREEPSEGESGCIICGAYEDHAVQTSASTSEPSPQKACAYCGDEGASFKYEGRYFCHAYHGAMYEAQLRERTRAQQIVREFDLAPWINHQDTTTPVEVWLPELLADLIYAIATPEDEHAQQDPQPSTQRGADAYFEAMRQVGTPEDIAAAEAAAHNIKRGNTDD